MIESLFLPLIAASSLASVQPASPAAPAEDAPSRSVPAADVELTAGNRAALRCSAAFAIVTNRPGNEGGVEPELRARGREFFVVTLAALMDEHKLDRLAIEREVRAEAEKLSQAGEVDAIMPACLLMLQAAGL